MAFVRPAMAQEPPPATRPAQSPRPTEEFERTALSVADQRALLYLYFRLNKLRDAQTVAREILRRHPNDRQTLILLTNIYLDRHEDASALQTARQLAEAYPDDVEAQVLLARAYSEAGQPTAAREILRELKERHQGDEPFRYEEQLARAATQSGDWPQAIRSYQSLLAAEQTEAEQRKELRRELDQLYRRHLPQLTLREMYIQPRSGQIFRSSVLYEQYVQTHLRAGLRYDRDDIQIKRAEFIRETNNDRYDVMAGWRLDRQPWELQVWAGGGSAGPVYRAALQRRLGEDAEVVLQLGGNQRATDSLLLEALDGRENRVALNWLAPLPGQFILEGQIQGRQLRLPHDTLGYGYVANVNLGRPLISRWPELRGGYRGLITGFSRTTNDPDEVNDVAERGSRPIDRLLLLDNLVESLHLHGLFISWEHDPHPRWHLRTDLSADYSLQRAEIGYSAEAGVSYFIARNFEWLLEGGYSTSAETSNAESELVHVTLALKILF